MGTQHFSQAFFFLDNNGKTEIIFFPLTNGPAQQQPPAHCRFRPSQPAREGEPARLGFGPRAWPTSKRGGGAGRGHDAGARDVAAVRCPPAANGQLRPSGDQRAGTQGSREDSEHRRAARGDRERARAPEWQSASSAARKWWRGEELSIEPYQRRGRSTEARPEERGRWRSVMHGQSSGGNGARRPVVPASERGGGHDGSGGERVESGAPARVLRLEKEESEKGEGMGAWARARRLEVERAGVTGVHAAVDAGVRSPRGRRGLSASSRWRARCARRASAAGPGREAAAGARAGRSRAASAAGPEVGRRPAQVRKTFFFLLFFSIFQIPKQFKFKF
jgi:hypothetical protein